MKKFYRVLLSDLRPLLEGLQIEDNPEKKFELIREFGDCLIEHNPSSKQEILEIRNELIKYLVTKIRK